MRVLVINASGQSGQVLRKIASEMTDHQFYFMDKIQIDVSNSMSIRSAFKKYSPQLVINSTEFEIMEMMCKKKGAQLVQISEKSGAQHIIKRLKEAAC